ncbi:hypothetical protein ACP4OV_022886 [Aristida adscensionis]
MSSSSAATAWGLQAGAWLGELAASALQLSGWAPAGHGELRPRQRPRPGGATSGKAIGGAAGAGRRAVQTPAAEEDVVRCGGAMSDATVCLLLDRFAPN